MKTWLKGWFLGSIGLLAVLILFVSGPLAWAGPNEDLINGVLMHDLNLVNQSLANGADPNLTSSVPGLPGAKMTPLYMVAAGDGNWRVDFVNSLLSHGADPNAMNYAPTHNTDTGAPTGFMRLTALFAASQWGNAAIVELLLQHGADPNARTVVVPDNGQGGETPLCIAVTYHRIEVVRILLSHGADPNMAQDNGGTPLGIARGKGYNDIVQLILSHTTR